MKYIRYSMTWEQLRESLIDWKDSDRIILIGNEVAWYKAEAISGELILVTERLNVEVWIDARKIKVQGVSDRGGNFIGYYVPDVKGKYHLIRSILNVNEEMMVQIEKYDPNIWHNTFGHP